MYCGIFLKRLINFLCLESISGSRYLSTTNYCVMAAQEHPTFGNGKICYIELPSRNLDESIDFYKTVFDWNVRKRDDGSVGFDDSVNEVSGTWRIDRKSVV